MTVRASDVAPQKTATLQFTDGHTEEHPLTVDNTLPKGWLLIEYTNGTAELYYKGVQRGVFDKTLFGRWRIRGTRTKAKTPSELARIIARQGWT